MKVPPENHTEQLREPERRITQNSKSTSTAAARLRWSFACIVEFHSMQQPAGSPIVRFGFALGAAFCVFGSPVMGFFLTRVFLEAKASANWPTASGILQKAEVGETSVNHYYADVAYTFSVAGHDYAGSRIAASDGEYNIRDGAVQAIQGLRVGQDVTVHYDPSNPNKSVLRAGAGFQEYFLLCLPVAIFSFGVYAFRLLHRTKKTSEQCGEPELPSTVSH